MKHAITWYSNPTNDLIKQLDADELDVFNTDIQDAIDGVIEDWEGK
jgi:hypothetical protein